MCLLLLALAPALLGPAGCQRWWGGGGEKSAQPAGRPFPERFALGEAIAETRAILPRLPPAGTLPPLGPPAPESGPAPAQAPTRLALVGSGPLLRPADFPGLPPRLTVEVHLDERDPPGGYLQVTQGQGGAPVRWPVLDSYREGPADGAFALTLRVVDGRSRLRYLVVLGVPFHTEGASYRALEGYLLTPSGPLGVKPAAGGRVPMAVYPLDFGYRNPHPPRTDREAAAWAAEVATLRTRYKAWRERQADLAALTDAADKLRQTDVPEAQRDQQRRDLASYAARADALRVKLAEDAAALRAELQSAYRGRVALAAAWERFTRTNAYRWLDTAGRKAAHAPLEALRPLYAELTQIHARLREAGADTPDLREAATAMEQALLAEPHGE